VIFQDELIVDLFAGGGGASAGIEAAAGRRVDIAINHDAVALAVHKANHPETEHLESDVWEVRPKSLIGSRKIGLLWASPDCTHFSVAKGGKPRKQNIRSLAWVVTRWAKDVRPRMVFLENVSEFKTWGPMGPNGQPDKSRMGETFNRWLARLKKLGYQVDYRVLDASLYGAPTRRRRLFLIARRDGLPILWPEVTHGPGRLPLHTAAECIDWTLPCPSIFERKKELAEKTLWRIAQGIRRFVLENPKPFIVRYNGPVRGGGQWRGQGLDEPLTTLDTSNRFGLVAPVVAGVGGRAGQSHAVPGDAPIGAITAKNDRALIAPHLVKVNHGKQEPRGESLEEPLSTVTATQRGHAIVAPTLIQTGYGEREGQAPRSLDIEQPLGTVVAGGAKHAVVAAHLSRQFGEGVGTSPDEPMNTVMPGGQGKTALVSAFLAKHFSERSGGFLGGQQLNLPLPTVTTKDHNSVVAANLLKLRGQCSGADLEEPMTTVTAGGFHVAEVRAFLTAYYTQDGTEGKGQSVLEPLRVVTTKARLGLVTVEGHEYQIVDISMRMLEPHELLRAQFGRFAAGYDLSPARTKAGMVRMIGNSVPPEVAEAIVRANAYQQARQEEVA
jgi:DNA (cytosine-5)-methyltransferase 1